jgi:hypothetical protein
LSLLRVNETAAGFALLHSCLLHLKSSESAQGSPLQDLACANALHHCASVLVCPVLALRHQGSAAASSPAGETVQGQPRPGTTPSVGVVCLGFADDRPLTKRALVSLLALARALPEPLQAAAETVRTNLRQFDLQAGPATGAGGHGVALGRPRQSADSSVSSEGASQTPHFASGMCSPRELFSSSFETMALAAVGC